MSVAASMKITQEVREYAASQKLSEADALKKGMEAKAVEFVKHDCMDAGGRAASGTAAEGAEIYKKA